MTTDRVRAIHREPTWGIAKADLARWNPALLPNVGPTAPSEIASLTERIETWGSQMNSGFDQFERKGVSGKLLLASQLIADGLELRTDLDTDATLDWRQASDTPATAVDAYQLRRQELGDRLESLAIIGAEVFRDANFWLPSQVGQRAWYRNARIMAQLLDGKRVGRAELGVAGVVAGLSAIGWRHRKVVATGIGRQLRSSSIFGWSNRRRVDQTNRRLRRAGLLNKAGARIDYARGEHLRAAVEVLDAAGVSESEANGLIDEALRLGNEVSEKPWRGLIHLRELVIHAELAPDSPEFMAELQNAIAGAIHYTHTPGKEWIVRDFALARALLKADGKSSRTTESVAITQSGSSIVPGVLANHPALLGLASHYMKPIQVYLNGVVAQSGTEHRRHKNVFKDFFQKGAVLDRAEFIERTVASILDEVELIAARNGGRFDLKTDLAFNFPIRVICEFIGIPENKASEVQHWAEASVRALDASAGLSLALLTEGNKSAGAFLDYLGGQVQRARNGESIPGIIGQVANTTELNDVELVSNLAGITFAGFETTTGLLSLGFLELLQHSEQVDYLRSQLVDGPEVIVDGTLVPDRDLRWFVWAHDERKGRLREPERADRYANLLAKLESSPELSARLDAHRTQEDALGRAVEEMLRWTAPGSVIPLTLEEDFELESPVDALIGGCPVAAGSPITFSKGQTITVDISAANRSGCPFGPGQFESRLGDFDVSRTDNTKHLSFGVTHICMGADLAVENAKRMIEGILRRMPELALDGEPDEQDGDLFIGLAALPVRISRRIPASTAR